MNYFWADVYTWHRGLADETGKLPEANTHEKKSQGKYSLEGALLLKTHAALQGLGKGEVV